MTTFCLSDPYGVLLPAEPLPTGTSCLCKNAHSARRGSEKRIGTANTHSGISLIRRVVAAPGCVRLSCQDVGRKFAGDPGDPLARAPISRRFCPRSVLPGTGVRVGSIVHVNVGQDRDERTVACIGECAEVPWGRIGQTQVNPPERRSL